MEFPELKPFLVPAVETHRKENTSSNGSRNYEKASSEEKAS